MKASRWQLLREQLSFERAHPQSRRVRLPLARKLLRVIPDSIALVLFNFGSSFGTNETIVEPEPMLPAPVPLLSIDEWPLHGDAERGLPLSDSVAHASVFTGYERVRDPLFVLRELHRVSAAGATISLEVTGRWHDPMQRRIATTEALSVLDASHPRSAALGLGGLFRVTSISDTRAELLVLKDTGAAHPRRIDIGCGTAKQPGYTGIDLTPLPGVDIVRDIDRHGLPFSDGTMSAVTAIHFAEHVRDLVFVMNEIHRVCCDQAIVTIEVPTLLGPHAAADPTHVRLFNARTFGYFTDEVPASYGGTTGKFAIVSQQVSTTLRVVLRVLKPRDTRASGTA